MIDLLFNKTLILLNKNDNFLYETNHLHLYLFFSHSPFND